MEKQTFEIPKGCSKVTVEQIGNTIVTSFESEKYLPKVGDCVKLYQGDHLHNTGKVSSTKGDLIYFEQPFILNGEKVMLDGIYAQNAEWFTFEQLTPEELQAEFNKLGYEYNFETHEATKIRWKPKEGEIYYYVSTGCKVIKAKNDNCYGDIELIKIGNCYRTPEEAEPRRQHYLNFKD